MKKTETVTITLDGVEVSGHLGMTILDLAQESGVAVPTLCHDPDLSPSGACRLCIVEIEGMRGTVSSCTTPAKDGMVAQTETPLVNRVRRAILELILANHHGDCLTCAKNQQCELQKVAT